MGGDCWGAPCHVFTCVPLGPGAGHPHRQVDGSLSPPFQISTVGSGCPAGRVSGRPQEPAMAQPWYHRFPGTHEPHLVAGKPLLPLP